MWTVTLCNGRDPLPVLDSWASRTRAAADLKRRRKDGYEGIVHRVGVSAPKACALWKARRRKR